MSLAANGFFQGQYDGDTHSTGGKKMGRRRFRGAWFDVRVKAGFSRQRPEESPDRLNHREKTMRFMMIVKANQDSEAGVMPSEELISAMGKYNEELLKAGVLLDLSGLQPTSKGARIKFSGGKRTVIDGPFAESKELIAGYWIIQVKSREEAIEWAKRAPAPHGPNQDSEIEVRQFFELEDFNPSEAIARARDLGKELEKKK
jgi:hypothetical protein